MQVVCIVPNNRKDRYDAIKKLCCVERPVPSQVVVSRTLSKKNMLMSVCTKIGIQLNCKLGGEVWAVDIPLNKLMVIGFDVYHDSATKGKSIGGFVASTNKHLTRYYSCITSQTCHMEICDQLKVCLTSEQLLFLFFNFLMIILQSHLFSGCFFKTYLATFLISNQKNLVYTFFNPK